MNLILIARRNPVRLLYPDLYEGCGGRLHWNETFVDGVRRHYKTEMGLDVSVIEERHSFYEIRKRSFVIPGIRFVCYYLDGIADSKNHTEIRWVSEEQLLGIPEELFIPGVKQDFLNILGQENDNG
jgi:ADP-ribose pyrophosphatase YjhB (NUDIX family)